MPFFKNKKHSGLRRHSSRRALRPIHQGVDEKNLAELDEAELEAFRSPDQPDSTQVFSELDDLLARAYETAVTESIQLKAGDMGELPPHEEKPTKEIYEWVSTSLHELRRRSGAIGSTNYVIGKLLESFSVLRFVGYAMIVLVLIDFASLLLGSELMNPVWEWSFFGATVERSPLLLLGVGLVFLGREHARGKLEYLPLKAVYWGALAAGIWYLLMLPLGISNSYRLNQSYEQQHTLAHVRVDEQLKQIGSYLEQESSDRSSVEVLPNQSAANGLSAAQAAAALGKATDNAKVLKSQADVQLASQKKLLLRQMISWLSGSLVVGLVLLVIWRKTRWTSLCKPKSKKRQEEQISMHSGSNKGASRRPSERQNAGKKQAGSATTANDEQQ